MGEHKDEQFSPVETEECNRKDDHLCSSRQSGLYGGVTRQKSLWSKKPTTDRSLPNGPFEGSECTREKILWFDERKTELFGGTARYCSWLSDQSCSKTRGTAQHGATAISFL